MLKTGYRNGNSLCCFVGYWLNSSVVNVFIDNPSFFVTYTGVRSYIDLVSLLFKFHALCSDADADADSNAGPCVDGADLELDAAGAVEAKVC
jgi:hypothetical protein